MTSSLENKFKIVDHTHVGKYTALKLIEQFYMYIYFKTKLAATTLSAERRAVECVIALEKKSMWTRVSIKRFCQDSVLLRRAVD